MAGKEGCPSGKVVIVVENLSVPFDRRVWNECRALRDAGYGVSTVSPMGRGRDTAWHEEIDGISVFRYPILQASGSFASYVVEYLNAIVMSFFMLWVVLLRRGFDVVQICNPPDLLIFPTLPFKLLGKKVIFDQHDLCPEIYATQRDLNGKPNLVIKVLLRLEALTYAWSDVVMVVNESCRRIAVGRGRRDDHAVYVVRNGPSVRTLQQAQPDERLKCGKRHLLTYVGMMGPQEGIDVLLRAVHALVHVHGRSDFHVQILGGGTVLDAMRAHAADLGLAHCVTFTGTVDHDRVMTCVATSDLCLCPDPKTPLSDKCSLIKAVEYMGLARPFVAFELEEVQDMAGMAAEYATPGDEADFAARIDRLLDEPERRAEMGRIGRERVLNRLTWEHSEKVLLAAYDHALGRAGSVGVTQE